MTSGNFHEDLARHGDEPRASERNLGVTFAVVLAAAVYWLLAGAAFLV